MNFMRAELKNGNVRAHCPDCDAITSFENTHKGQFLSTVIVDKSHSFDGRTFSRILYEHLRCASCNRGGMATIHDNGRVVDGVLEEFFPISVGKANIPHEVPVGILAEYREAELCLAVGAHRAASALFRSVLEKTLRQNGFVKDNLEKKIDSAAADSIITESRRKRAHEDIRVLGNDVLHDEWREISPEDAEQAAHYAQRILEDFYDDRASVVHLLTASGRIGTVQGDAQSSPQPD
jgi:hypothetical protein